MELSAEAMKKVPEIVRWLDWKARTLRGRTAQNGVHMAARLLDSESARLIPDDTFYLFDRLGDAVGQWPWTVVTAPEFEHANGSVSGPVIGWSRRIADRPDGQTYEVGHESIVTAMQQIVEQQSSLTAGDNPPVDDLDVNLVSEVLTAANRAELLQALAELTPKVNVAIVRLAAFGSVS